MTLMFFRDNIKPLIEFGLAEASHSVAFSLHASGTLLTGMNNKHIKIFDLRGTEKFLHLLWILLWVKFCVCKELTSGIFPTETE